MSVEYYIDLVRFADMMIILLIIMLFIKNWNRDQNVKIAIFYLISIMGYLMVSWKLVYQSDWFVLALLCAFSVPILFWYFSKSIFDDHFKIDRFYLLLYIVIITIYFLIFYYNHILDRKNAGLWYSSILNSSSQMISLVFVVLGIAEAYKGRSTDLLESRIKFRTAFIFVSGLVIILTLVAELGSTQKEGEIYLNLLQKISIAAILFALFFFLIEFKSGFFFEKQKIKKPMAEANSKISETFNHLINDDKVYLQGGLTVRNLAEKMNEQEYKVRRYINQHLGFRNFNDFLNSYRIQDACEILLDQEKSDLTILEIAYSLGYNSLGPFNKAFKQHTGTTPTAYRKQG